MIKQLANTAILLITSVLLVQCGKDCAKESCPPVPTPVFGVRLVNSSGKDLLVGASKVYDTSQVRIFGKKAADGVEEDTKAYFYSLSDTAMIGAFTVKNIYSGYYLKISNVATDSLFFTYNIRKTECCDNSYFSFVKWNTSSISPPVNLPLSSVYKIVK